MINPRIMVIIPMKLGIGRPKTFLKASERKKNEKNPSNRLKIMRIKI